jgi:two-component system, chemotaxis family, chemotaxis protein CheY
MLRVLIVEDEPVNQEFLLLALKNRAECQAVGSGEDALAAVTQALDAGRPFDVVFLDLLLPGIGGLQTLEKLRHLEGHFELPEEQRARVIITTALDDDRAASRAFIQGRAVSYMTKPFRVSDIRDELAKLGLLDA